MEISTRRVRALFAILVLAIAFAGPSMAVRSQEPASIPRAEEIANLRSGMWCQVWMKASPPPGPHSGPDHEGTLEAVLKDEIVISRVVEGRSERITPVLGQLPFIGRYFRQVGVGRAVVTSRIAIDEVAQVKVVDTNKATAPGR